MTTSNRRIALLTGASISALGLAMPAYAAVVTTTPGISQVDTTEPVVDTLVICDLDTTTNPPTSPCIYGVEAIGASPAIAVVNDDLNGAMEQLGISTTDAVLLITNDGFGEIAAHANATAVAGVAVASASIFTAISQVGIASDTVTLSLVNDGTLVIDAAAIAIGTDASANALIDVGIMQIALAGNDAIISLTNDGVLVFDAPATALGVTEGDAMATVSQAIFQSAVASSDASVAVNNGAGASIDVIADADVILADGPAFASANVTSAFDQNVVAGDAGVALVANEGLITIAASALAAGGTAAGTFLDFNDALASVNNAIDQSVVAGSTASATVNNAADATLNVSAVAHALGGNANAFATIEDVIEQDVISGADALASASILNDGAISVFASALANGTLEVDAGVFYESIIDQEARAGLDGNAVASLTNNGSITVTGLASARGVAQVTGIAAEAFVGADSLFNQSAQATLGTGTAAAAEAMVSIVNGAAGVISASFAATAVGPVASVGAHADAEVDDFIVQNANGNGGAAAVANLANEGTINLAVAAAANAVVGGSADASASIEGGIVQSATAIGGGDANVGLANGGTIDLGAAAVAIAAAGLASASATVSSGISQSASAAGGGDAFASLTNGGTIAIHATATATGDVSAFAGIFGGIRQHAIAGATEGGTTEGATLLGGIGLAFVTSTAADAFVGMTNTGAISMTADAMAVDTGTGPAMATATLSSAIVQAATATGNAGASLINEGSIALNAIASAFAVDTAIASANNNMAIIQDVTGGGTASAFISNTGSITIGAHAFASASGIASATADVGTLFATTPAAINQFANGVDGSLVTLVNSGSILISANATAVATAAEVGLAVASANAFGVYQSAVDGTANFSNLGGDFTVIASANAFAVTTEGTPTGIGSASANALGLWQDADVASLVNTGSFAVIANAFTSGYSGTAAASALGYGRGGTALTLDVTNSGNFSVSANAAAVSDADAHAVGMAFGATATGTATAALIDGTILNSGSIDVVANASATFLTSQASATATGILMTSGVNTATITNSGSLTVDAITNGGPATANGIVALGGGGGALPGLADVLTINNSGDLIVRESVDGGASFTRGMAIDVAAAPNNTVINLLGGGDIYGNIDVQDGDAINVTGGETTFNGIINPECMPVGGPTALTFDNPALNACGEGTLTINNGGALHLLIDPDEGPSYAFVETFTVGGDGTIIFDLPQADGAAPIGTYPQIYATTANLDGTLVANIAGTGIFDTTLYNNVIDAVTRNGTFDQCIINGVPLDSPLLDVTCVYDALANVDISLVRTAFDAVPGLTRNQTAVASGLECIFDPDMTGSLGEVLADLFTFDANEFPEALDQLGGAAYASYLQSFNSLGVHYNDVLAKATDCEIPALAGSVLECRTAPTHVWAQVDFQNRRTDRDVEAAGYDADRWTALIGFDMNVGSQAIVGASIGKVTNRVDVSRFGDQIKATGHQLGAYGVFDPGPFYVKAMGTYNWFDGDSERNIDFTPMGGISEGQLRGDPDIKMWTLGLHGGYRMAMGATSTLTPYINLDYTNVRMDGFTEVGMGDVGLTIEDAKEKRTTLTGGVKYATLIMGGVAEADLGYRYQFGDRRSNFTAHFLGEEACDFDIISAAEKRGEILAGLSFGGKAGPVDVRVSYQGLFSGTSTSHAGNFKLVLPLGGRAEPPPPEYVAPPPPPPPPPEYVPPPPPPPPPPPEPSGERG